MLLFMASLCLPLSSPLGLAALSVGLCRVLLFCMQKDTAEMRDMQSAPFCNGRVPCCVLRKRKGASRESGARRAVSQVVFAVAAVEDPTFLRDASLSCDTIVV